MEPLRLPCPCCGEPDANVYLRLWDGGFECQECEVEFEADFVREVWRRWQPVLMWLDARPAPAPAVEPTAGG